MLIVNICLYREKITPCDICGGDHEWHAYNEYMFISGMLITRVVCIQLKIRVLAT